LSLGHTNLKASQLAIVNVTIAGLYVGPSPGSGTVLATAFFSANQPYENNATNATAATWIVAASDQGYLKMVQLLIRVTDGGSAYAITSGAR